MKLSRTKTSLIIFFVVAVSILVFLSGVNYKSKVIFGGKTYTVDVADTYLTLKQGLSERRSLGADEGMFFIFNKPDTYGFWMKDMNFPLDIIWINENYKIVHIERDVKPDSYPKVFYPSVGASYVLEIRAGETEKLHVSVGDSIQFLDKTTD